LLNEGAIINNWCCGRAEADALNKAFKKISEAHSEVEKVRWLKRGFEKYMATVKFKTRLFRE